MLRQLAAIFAGAVSLNAAAITVVNSSFEDPQLAPGQSVSNPVDTGWIWDPTIGGFPDAGGWSIVHPDPDIAGPVLDGNNAAVLQPNGALYQVFDSQEFVPGSGYQVGVDFAFLQDGCCEDFQIKIVTGDLFDNTNASINLVSFFGDNSPLTITHLTFDFVLQNDFDPDEDSIALLFINYSIASRSAVIDNVSLTVVPVPAALWLFVAACGALGPLRRKRPPA